MILFYLHCDSFREVYKVATDYYTAELRIDYVRSSAKLYAHSHDHLTYVCILMFFFPLFIFVSPFFEMNIFSPPNRLLYLRTVEKEMCSNVFRPKIDSTRQKNTGLVIDSCVRYSDNTDIFLFSGCIWPLRENRYTL